MGSSRSTTCNSVENHHAENVSSPTLATSAWKTRAVDPCQYMIHCIHLMHAPFEDTPYCCMYSSKVIGFIDALAASPACLVISAHEGSNFSGTQHVAATAPDFCCKGRIAIHSLWVDGGG
jgi:hypothetical protein